MTIISVYWMMASALVFFAAGFAVAGVFYKGTPKEDLPPVGAVFSIECVASDNSFLAKYLGKMIFFKGYPELKKGYYEVIFPGDEKLAGSKTKMLKRINEVGEKTQERHDTSQKPKETR